MKKEFTCIVCPNGCTISAKYGENLENIRLEGAMCKRGEAYVRQELTDPRRTIASSVLVTGGESDLVSVRLTAPIPPSEKTMIVSGAVKVSPGARCHSNVSGLMPTVTRLAL